MKYLSSVFYFPSSKTIKKIFFGLEFLKPVYSIVGRFIFLYVCGISLSCGTSVFTKTVTMYIGLKDGVFTILKMRVSVPCPSPARPFCAFAEPCPF